MHGNGSISEHGLRTGGGDDDLAGAVLELVRELGEDAELNLGVVGRHTHHRGAGNLDVVHLDIRDGCSELAAPVDEAVVPAAVRW